MSERRKRIKRSRLLRSQLRRMMRPVNEVNINWNLGVRSFTGIHFIGSEQ
jgi:hypothetical protein